MTRSGKLVQSELVDTLAIAKLSFQYFLEIEPLFVRSHMTDLGKTWRILNNEGTHHDIIFNKNEDLPLVIGGWTELQKYYTLPNDVVIIVSYYGNNNFEVVRFKEITAFEELPNFHSRFINHIWIYAFDVDLSPITVSKPKLQL
ncbi:hypothetical protein RYX36_007674 [Vicia faba]